MTVNEKRIDDYLSRYATALAEFDAEAAVDLWSAPGMIADDQFSGVIETRDAMIQALEQSYPLYRQLGLASVDYELFERSVLSERLVLVRVRWIFLDDEGDHLTDATSYYLLRDEEEGLRAVVCIETDSMEKLQALAAEKGVELPPSE